MEDDKKTALGGDDVDPNDVEDGSEGKEAQAAEEGEKPAEKTEERPLTKERQRERDSYYAQRRREQQGGETKPKDVEAVRRETELNVRKEYVGKDVLDALGLAEIKDEDDLFLAQAYEEGSKAGDENPARYAYLKLRGKGEEAKAETARAAEAQRKEEEAIRADQLEFEKAYGKKTSEVVTDRDSEFMRMYGPLIGAGNLTQLYGLYMAAKGNQQKESEEGKSKGVFPTNGSSVQRKAEKDPDEMTDAEFSAYWKSKYQA